MVRICLQTCMNACVPYNNILWILVLWFFQNSTSLLPLPLLLLLYWFISLKLFTCFIETTFKKFLFRYAILFPFILFHSVDTRISHFCFSHCLCDTKSFFHKKKEKKTRSRWYILWFYLENVNALSSILYKIWFIHDSLGMHFGFYRKIILQQIENAYANKLHHHIQFHFQEPHGSTKCLLLCFTLLLGLLNTIFSLTLCFQPK